MRSIKISMLCVLLFCILGLPLRGQAHPASASAISVSSTARDVTVQVQLPLQQLALAAPELSVTDGSALAGETLRLTAAYLARHIYISSGAGERYNLDIDQLQRIEHQGELYLSARMLFHAPPTTSTYVYQLHSDAIVHKVRSHRTYLQRLYGDAQVQDLDVLHFQHDTVLISQVKPGWQAGFMSMLGNGAKHIAEGADHLLFLFCLLLTAPLYVSDGRWLPRGDMHSSLLKITAIVSAFTLGHCVTLAYSVFTRMQTDSQIIEIFVALSVAFAALHAFTPVLLMDASLLAGMFGLIHGVAFANALQDFGFDMPSRMLGLLGFNLGIEGVQLFLVVLILPWLILLSRYAFYRYLRVVAALLALILALGWVLQRSLQLNLFWDNWANISLPVASGFFYLLSLFALLGIILMLREWRRDWQSDMAGE